MLIILSSQYINIVISIQLQQSQANEFWMLDFLLRKSTRGKKNFLLLRYLAVDYQNC